jgi:hypothetical protein
MRPILVAIATLFVLGNLASIASADHSYYRQSYQRPQVHHQTHHRHVQNYRPVPTYRSVQTHRTVQTYGHTTTYRNVQPRTTITVNYGNVGYAPVYGYRPYYAVPVVPVQSYYGGYGHPGNYYGNRSGISLYFGF